MEKIEYAGIVVMNIAGAMIAQIMIHSRQSIWIIGVPIPVDDVEPLPGVGMEKVQTVRNLRWVRDRSGRREEKTNSRQESCAYAAANGKKQAESPHKKVSHPGGGPLLILSGVEVPGPEEGGGMSGESWGAPGI
jgi:hypothetical protein